MQQVLRGQIYSTSHSGNKGFMIEVIQFSTGRSIVGNIEANITSINSSVSNVVTSDSIMHVDLLGSYIRCFEFYQAYL